MTGRRALVGLSLLCALVFTAFSAASASAATSGTTAFTCSSTASVKDYSDAHCDTTATAPSNFGHEALATVGTAANCASGVANTCTEKVEGTNENTKTNTTLSTPAVLEATVGGIATKLEATGVKASGVLENKLTGEVHSIVGSKITITYTGVTVVSPANCKVPGNTITTAALKSESVEGTPMTEKFSPATGTTFVTLHFEKSGAPACSIAAFAPNVTGTVSAEPSGQMAAGGGKGASTGATLNVNVTKASKQLSVGGQEAALTALETIKMEGGSAIVTTGPPF